MLANFRPENLCPHVRALARASTRLPLCSSRPASDSEAPSAHGQAAAAVEKPKPKDNNTKKKHSGGVFCVVVDCETTAVCFVSCLFDVSNKQLRRDLQSFEP